MITNLYTKSKDSSSFQRHATYIISLCWNPSGPLIVLNGRKTIIIYIQINTTFNVYLHFIWNLTTERHEMFYTLAKNPKLSSRKTQVSITLTFLLVGWSLASRTFNNLRYVLRTCFVFTSCDPRTHLTQCESVEIA